MMTDCFSFMTTNGMGWMMLGAGLFWLLVLGAAALIKYLRPDRGDDPAGSRATAHPGGVS